MDLKNTLLVTCELERLRIFGVPWHPVSMSSALDVLEGCLSVDRFHLVVTLGTEMVMRALKRSDFLDVLERAHLVVPDGIGLVWAARWCGYPVVERVAGIDLVQAMLCREPFVKQKFFFLGSEPGVAEEAVDRLRKRFSGLKVAGVQHGFFSDEVEVVNRIASSGADILLVGLGSPRQEMFLARYGERLRVKIGVGVGGSFDVWSGRLRRAPEIMIRLGLEWLYRLVRQPSRVKRMLALPYFGLKVMLAGRKAVIRERPDHGKVAPCGR